MSDWDDGRTDISRGSAREDKTHIKWNDKTQTMKHSVW